MITPRVLVLGWIGSTNLGDELIAEAACDLLRGAGCAPSVVTVDEAASARLGVPMVRHSGARDAIGLARALCGFDGALFGGGGLVQDETGPLNIPFHLSRLATARALRVPWAGLALGFGDVRRRSGRALVRTILRGSVAMSVRDHASADRCAALTGARPVIAADPVFTRPTDLTEQSDHLVVSLRRANEPGQRRLETSEAPDRARVRRWAEIIDAVARHHAVEVRFVAWERGQDHELHEAVAAQLHTPHVIESPGAGVVVQRMGAGRLVLTMRYHGAIAALLQGRPTVVLDYSPKMADLVAESAPGLALASIDADPATITDLMSSVIDHDEARADALAAFRRRANHNTTIVGELAQAARRRAAR